MIISHPLSGTDIRKATPTLKTNEQINKSTNPLNLYKTCTQIFYQC